MDVELSDKGIKEAEDAGRELKDVKFDVIHTSNLIRAKRTAEIVLSANSASFDVETKIDWRLNERNYGSLQGQNKAETAEKHGSEQVRIWRRSFDVAPPDGESLEMTAKRTIPYFKEEIISDLEAGMNVLVSAHGNSLRSIVMYIERISPSDIVSFEIPTGIPRYYEYIEGEINLID
jgi:2,3-bisphosphoglycerate-dependent phosphoglycerate mutase